MGEALSSFRPVHMKAVGHAVTANTETKEKTVTSIFNSAHPYNTKIFYFM